MVLSVTACVNPVKIESEKRSKVKNCLKTIIWLVLFILIRISMAKLLKTLTFFITLLILSLNSQSQTLIQSNLDLNPGGYINDVVWDEWREVYIVVGNFESINGTLTKNIAFLDDQLDMATNIDHNISNINREILAVEVNNAFMLIGGGFDTINSSKHTALAKFNFNGATAIPTFFLDPLDLDIGPAYTLPYAVVNDIKYSSNRFVFTGEFLSLFFNGPNYTEVDGIAGIYYSNTGFLNPFYSNGDILDYQDDITTHGNPGGVHKRTFNNQIEVIDNSFTVATNVPYYSGGGAQSIVYSGLHNFNTDGSPNHIYTANSYDRDITRMHGFDDLKLIVTLESNNTINDYPFEGYSLPNALPIGGSTTPGPGNYLRFDDLVGYDDLFFTATTIVDNGSGLVVGLPNQRVLARRYVSTSSVPQVWASDIDCVSDDLTNSMTVARNHLFFSQPEVFTAEGATRQGLAVYGLPPHRTGNFTIADTNICAGLDSIRYAVPPAKYADGYKWEYTGNDAHVVVAGISYEISNGGMVFQDNPVYYNDVQIRFGANATIGDLSVTPYTQFDTPSGSDTLYAAPETISLTSLPLPNPSVIADTFFTCVDTTIVLFGSSDDITDSYTWIDVSNAEFDNDSLEIYGGTQGANPIGIYQFIVRDTLGCSTTDTVNVGEQITPPTYVVNYSDTALNCVITSVFVEVVPDNAADSVQWMVSTTNVQTFTSSSNNHTLNVISDETGCVSSETIALSNYNDNVDVNNVLINEVPYWGGALTPIDTLDCNLDSVQFSIPVSPNTLEEIYWLDINTGDSVGQQMYLSELDTFSIFTINTESQCEAIYSVVIQGNYNTPLIDEVTFDSLNCSNSTSVLSGSIFDVTPVTEEWFDIFEVSLGANPSSTSTQGQYIYEVTFDENGCSSRDTITVPYFDDIEIDLISDTLICDGASAQINATAINIVSPSYNWSTGSTTNLGTATGGVDQYVTVEAFGPGSCYGIDSTLILIPENVFISYTSFLPCAGSSNGTLTVQVDSGGVAPYQYSLDDINYSSNPTFGGVSPGVVDVYVRDTIGCTYYNQAFVDPNGAGPNVDFLFSTYNYEFESSVLVNVSDPGFDTIIWNFPSNIIVVEDSNYLTPEIATLDTGWYQLEMTVDYGGCTYTVVKDIYFGDYSTDFPNLNSNFEIDNVIVSPNPTTSVVNIEVDLNQPLKVNTIIADLSGNVIFQDVSSPAATNHLISYTFDSQLPAGSYVLRVFTDFDMYSTIIELIP